MKINEYTYQVTDLKSEFGETLYSVKINTGLAWVAEFLVLAYNETEAVDKVADYLVAEQLTGLYHCYSENNDSLTDAGYISAGNTGIMILVESITVVKN